MDINLKEQYEDFLLLGKEVCIKVLKETDDKRKVFLENNDLDAVKSIDEEIFPKFEKMFFEFSLELGDEIDEEKMEKIENIIYSIIESYNFDEDYLWKEVRKRLDLEGNSGAEVVKKLYEYQKREISNTLDELERTLQVLYKNQKRVEMAMADSIQQTEEMKYFEEVKKNGKKIDAVEEKIAMLLDKASFTETVLDTKWRYEIYGTTPKEVLLETYKVK